MEPTATVTETADAIAKVLEALPTSAVGIAAMAVAGLIALTAFFLYRAGTSSGRQKTAKALSIFVLAVVALLFLLAGYILTIYQPRGQVTVLVRLEDDSGRPIPASSQISGEIRTGRGIHKNDSPSSVLTITGMSRDDLKTEATLVLSAPGYETASLVTNIVEDRQIMTVTLHRKTYEGIYRFRTVCQSQTAVGSAGVQLRLATTLTTTSVVSDAQGYCTAALRHAKEIDQVEAVALRGGVQVGYVNLTTQSGLLNVEVTCHENVQL